MIRDTDNVRLLGFAVDVEQLDTIEGSIKIDCQAGWGLSGAPVDDCAVLIKHSGDVSYLDLETNHINLETWDGTTQTFDYRIIAGASAIYKERVFPLRVSRFAPLSYGTTFDAGSFIFTGQSSALDRWLLSADAGTFALTGQDVTLDVPYSFSDADAEAFSDEIGTLSTLQKEAIDNLVIDLKAASLWALMEAIYPFIGGSASAHSYNLKNPAQYQITWHGTVAHNGNGITGNGSTGWGDTGLNSSTDLTVHNTHISVYSRTAGNSSQSEIGAAEADLSFWHSMSISAGGDLFATLYGDNVNEEMAFPSGGATGHFIATCRASNSRETYKNGSTIQSRTGTTVSQLPNENIGILTMMQSGTASSFSSRNLAFASIGAGLSDANASAFYTCVQDFQTALSRNV